MNEELAMTLGSRIRRFRLHAGHTQAQAARALGLPPLVVSRLERGKLLPTPVLLVALCSAFRVSADTLLGLSKVHS